MKTKLPFAGQTNQSNDSRIDPVEPSSINLPKGGGAIRGIDEQFKVNAANGTASLTIPIPLSPSRNEMVPDLSLSYNSGSGNGAFGLGWALSIPSININTAKQLPVYSSKDTYVISGAEELIPVLKKDAFENWEKAEKQLGSLHIAEFRPRTEGLFARIEKINDPNRGIYWKVTDRNNTTTFYGYSANSRISNPKNQEQIYEWLAEFSFDDKGNWIQYLYKKENSELLPNDLSNAHRLSEEASFTNTYLKAVRYGNKTPFYQDEVSPYIIDLPQNNVHFFKLIFDFGEHDLQTPTPEEMQPWDLRPDSFSRYRSGFEIRTQRLCKRILLFHCFNEEAGFETPYLVKSLDLEYAPSAEQSEVTYLKSATQSGYIRSSEGTYRKKSLPPLTLEYEKLAWHTEHKNIAKNQLNTPTGLKGNYLWTDLYAEGISGVLSEQESGWFYHSNMGGKDGEPTFTPAKQVLKKPSINKLNNQMVTLGDLEANGTRQLIYRNGAESGFYNLKPNSEDWESFETFENYPKVDFQDPNLRLIDLTGDGRLDLVVSENNAFLWYPSEGKNGYAQSRREPIPFEENSGPSIVFADVTQSVFLADMSGDGLTDIVRIRNGEICYWPNLGYGRFGSKVSMGDAPVFDYSDTYSPQFLHLADFTGTGTTDVMYVDTDGFRIWTNLNGNSFSAANIITDQLPINQNTSISVVDLFGNGVPCIVWSSDLPENADSPLRYIDLMNSRKPHLLKGYRNNLGGEVLFNYKSSTHYYLEDKKEGNPWITKLPFPVHVISEQTTIDHINKVQFTVEYSYHHGYYDHEEKEFRGFGRVDQLDTQHYEEWSKSNEGNTLEQSQALYQPPVLTKTWYHTGAYPTGKSLITQFQSEFWTEEKTKKGFPVYTEEAPAKDVELINEVTPNSEMTASEMMGAHRSCRGIALRTEIFALEASSSDPDEISRDLTPVSVALQNCRVQLVQPTQDEIPACFIASVNESLNYQYEREEDDPRIAQQLVLRTDEYNNVLELCNIVYPRQNPDQSLSNHIQGEQAKTYIVLNKNTYTNDVINDAVYRLRVPSEIQTFELTAISKEGAFYQKEDFQNVSTIPAIEFHQSPSETEPQKRCVEHVRHYFLDESLSNHLPLNELSALGIPSHSSQLVYKEADLSYLYEDRLGDFNTLLSENGYTLDATDNSWWISSGNNSYLDISKNETVDAVKNRFFVPLAVKDPLGTMTEMGYFKDYYLFPEYSVDALNNKTAIETFDFRTLLPKVIRDINNNLSATLTDELGMPVASALLGKDLDEDGIAELQLADNLNDLNPGSEADQLLVHEFFTTEDSVRLQEIAESLLKNASSRIIYQLDAFQNEGKPVRTASITREKHAANLSENESSPLKIQFEYSDGSGNVIMAKVQADPGIAQKAETIDGEITVSSIDTSLMQPTRLRWLGNGRTVFNNKGNAVKQYEPYFSVSPGYENSKELRETGVTAILYYDALGRQIKTEFPDGTFTKTEFTSWMQQVFDQNDTVLDSQWYDDRFYRRIDNELISIGKNPEKEFNAAEKSAKHSGTAGTVNFDTLGRPISGIDHNRDLNGNDLFQETQTRLDIEGNPIEIVDARGNTVMRYRYNLIGQIVYQNSMDAGERWMFTDAMGNPVKSWDSRNHTITQTYDIVHRPLTTHVFGGSTEEPLDNVFQSIVYGEGLADDQLKNLRGQVVAAYDTAGKNSVDRFDIKGNPESQLQQFARNYKDVVNWQTLDDQLLEDEIFVSEFQYDALGRVVRSIMPDGSINEPVYGPSGLLNRLNITQNGVKETFVKSLSYDAKGQRQHITYGNDVNTNYRYDPKTYRLIHLKTQRSNGRMLQDLTYTYDPMGNITSIEDAVQPTTFFGNHQIDACSEYVYDALYQLIEAKGREHAGQALQNGNDNWNDESFIKNYQPNDSMAWRDYTQFFSYDAVGNIQQLKHEATGGNFTRNYEYDAATNRLLNTTVGQQTYNYEYHENHGMITSLPHLSKMTWNFRDELQSVATQVVNNGVPETTYYVYNAEGIRVRKVTENTASSAESATKKEERYYLGAVEVYRKHTGAHAGLERKTVHVSDDSGRIAMIDSRNGVNDGTEERIVRYQLSNHLGSASLEIDGSTLAKVISYEEYHPYGTTAYQATSKEIQVAKKRYRYTGMERDDESGLSYHNARYYISWLGRWLKPDPIGIGDGVNDYAYVKGNPVKMVDISGKNSLDFSKDDSYYHENPEEFERTEHHVLSDKLLIMKEVHPEFGEFYRKFELVEKGGGDPIVISVDNVKYEIETDLFEVTWISKEEAVKLISKKNTPPKDNSQDETDYSLIDYVNSGASHLASGSDILGLIPSLTFKAAKSSFLFNYYLTNASAVSAAESFSKGDYRQGIAYSLATAGSLLGLIIAGTGIILAEAGILAVGSAVLASITGGQILMDGVQKVMSGDPSGWIDIGAGLATIAGATMMFVGGAVIAATGGTTAVAWSAPVLALGTLLAAVGTIVGTIF